MPLQAENIAYFEGLFLPEKEIQLLPTNRGFLYGDGFFETSRLFNGELPFWEFHWQRIEKSAEILGLENHFSSEDLLEKINELLQKNQLKNARIRINFYRKGEGLYTPQSNQTAILITCSPLESCFFPLQAQKLEIGVCRSAQKKYSSLSFLKSMGAQVYVLAAIEAQKNGWQSALVFNSKGKVADCVAQNIFWIFEDKIYTPPLSDGGVAGTMRQFLLDFLPKKEIEISEKSCSPDELKMADAIFLTNAIQGVQAVTYFEGRCFEKNRQVAEIQEFVNCFIA